MRALIFEQWAGGHYFNYLECLVPRLAAIAQEVVVAITRHAGSSPAFARQLGHLRKLPGVRFDEEVAIPGDRWSPMFRLRLGRNLVEAIVRSKPDIVFLPSADEQLLALPLQALGGAGRAIRATSIEAVVHYRAYTARANLRERLLSAVQSELLHSRAFSRLHFVNFLQFEDAVSRRLPLARMARAAGDPVPQSPRIARHAARRALGLDCGGRLVGMVGGLDARKAVPASLAAFRAAKLASTDRFLLAGKLAPDYAKLVRETHADLVRSGRLVLLDRYLAPEELDHAFAALDLHCSVYNDFSGLSSLTLKSIAAGVPVIVADRPGWARAAVKRFAVGRAADAANAEGYARTMREALAADPADFMSDAVLRLLRFHSVANFTEGVLERASALAGKPPAAPVVPWSWVLDALPPERRHLR